MKLEVYSLIPDRSKLSAKVALSQLHLSKEAVQSRCNVNVDRSQNTKLLVA